jgi:hypothetical protein
MCYNKKMSKEFLSGHEPADQIDLDQLLDTMKRFLVQDDDLPDNADLPRATVGMVVYDVENESSLSNDILEYSFTLYEDEMTHLDPLVKSTLHIGRELVLGYTPKHCLRAKNTGKLDTYPESFNALITASPDSGLKTLSFMVTHPDIHDPTFVGYRHEVPSESRQQHDRHDNVYLSDMEQVVVRAAMADLDTFSRQECEALMDVVSFIRQLK